MANASDTNAHVVHSAPRRPIAQSPTGGRVPPHNLEAEASLLGAMLLSREAIAAVGEVRLATRRLLPAGQRPRLRRHHHSRCPRRGRRSGDGGRRAGPGRASRGHRWCGHPDRLQASTPAIGNAARYARIVEEHALLRRLIGVGSEVCEIGYSLPSDVAEAVDQAEALLFDVAQRRVSQSISPLTDVLSRQLDYLEALVERGDSITGVPTGFVDLDHQLAGLQPSNLIVIGGRPGTGKTSLALGIAAHAALEADAKVLVFSLEMSERELGQRLLAAEARVDSTRLRNGSLVGPDWNKISQAVGRLRDAAIAIDDTSHLTVLELRAKARRHKSAHGLDLIIVDYLQLMTGRPGAENRTLEVSEISRGLKLLARELDVPVVALCQLSRSLESRADKRPMLSDLRDCRTNRS